MPGIRTCPTCKGLYVGPSCPTCRDAAARKPSASPGGPAVPGYEMLETLGKGGMGIVYKARQVSSGRLVALKIPPGDGRTMLAFAGRFEREAAALRSLRHPNIVAWVDGGRTADLFYVAMEFVEGPSLRRILHERRLSVEETLRLMLQLCDGLEYAHARGVVHRDIKPDNVLIEKSGRVKIADFGLAKLVGPAAADGTSGLSLTVTGAAMGTSSYAAPEQLVNAKAVDPRADIYSAGAMLYELLTGQLPLGHDMRPSLKAEVPGLLDEATARALSTEPARRFPDAAAFREALLRISAR